MTDNFAELRKRATAREIDYLNALETHGTQRAAAAALGCSRGTLGAALERARRRVETAPEAPRRPSAELEIPSPPDPNEPIADLIARKKARHARDQAAEAFHKLVPIRVRQPGPVAICAIGDPHVDDDRCDIEAIERDMTVIGRTDGMFALHVGDITNNWVGRLGRLYAHQSTTASDGIRLAEWMFGLAPPLAVVGGNHDVWNEGMSWLNFCVKQAGCNLVQAHGVRIELQFPKGGPTRRSPTAP